MRIVLLCATQRGYRFLQTLLTLLPDVQLVVFSFREEPWEPPFLENIQQLTLAHGGQFFEAKWVDHPALTHFWQATQVDLMLVVSWRYLIPPDIYQRSQLGAYVFHDALLPAYRGFSPTVWAMINGEDHTGVTLFAIGQSMDAGAIVDQVRVPIAPDAYIAEVLEQVTVAYLDLLTRNLFKLLDQTVTLVAQDETQATYTCKRLPADNQIDWRGSTTDIYNLIRAVSPPYPGAFTYLKGEKVIVLAARRLTQGRHYVGRIPGRVVEIWPDTGTVVLTGDGSLLLTQLQLEQATPVCATAILHSLQQTLGR